MTYRFLWDEEPTDEQLQALMQEVGEDVRRESEQIERQIKEKLEEGKTETPHRCGVYFSTVSSAHIRIAA